MKIGQFIEKLYKPFLSNCRAKYVLTVLSIPTFIWSPSRLLQMILIFNYSNLVNLFPNDYSLKLLLFLETYGPLFWVLVLLLLLGVIYIYYNFVILQLPVRYIVWFEDLMVHMPQKYFHHLYQFQTDSEQKKNFRGLFSRIVNNDVLASHKLYESIVFRDTKEIGQETKRVILTFYLSLMIMLMAVTFSLGFLFLGAFLTIFYFHFKVLPVKGIAYIFYFDMITLAWYEFLLGYLSSTLFMFGYTVLILIRSHVLYISKRFLNYEKLNVNSKHNPHLVCRHRLNLIKQHYKYSNTMNYFTKNGVTEIYSAVVYYSTMMNAYLWYRTIFLNKRLYEHVFCMCIQFITYIFIFSLLILLIIVSSSFYWIRNHLAKIIWTIELRSSKNAKLKLYTLYEKLLSRRHIGVTLFPDWTIKKSSLFEFASVYVFFLSTIFKLMRNMETKSQDT